MNRPEKKLRDPQLRVAAEAVLAKAGAAPLEGIPMRPAEELLHDLQVHQIELELQNETLRQAQIALEESRDRYVDLYEFAPVGYLTLGGDGMIADINLTGTGLLRGDRRHLLRRRFSSFVIADDRDRWARNFMRVAKTGAAGSVELSMQRGDGTVFEAQLDCSQASGRHVGTAQAGGVRIALRDISARKQAEAEQARLAQVLHDKNLELERAKAEAERANLAKSQFLSSMSHELRTPLNAILGFAQLVDAGASPLTDSQKASVGQILKAGWYLLELVNEILDLAVIDSGKTSLTIEPVALAAVMRESVSMIEPLAQKYGIGVSSPQLDNPYVVRGDRIRLKQVLVNLLSNAVKYNKAGGSVVVDWTLRPADSVRLSVRDTGHGLAQEKLAQLFQPFNRLGVKAGVAQEGTGIGLVVSKRLIELMGGVIGVDSVPGTGSVFWIEMKLAAEAGAGAAAAESTEAHPAHREL